MILEPELNWTAVTEADGFWAPSYPPEPHWSELPENAHVIAQAERELAEELAARAA